MVGGSWEKVNREVFLDFIINRFLSSETTDNVTIYYENKIFSVAKVRWGKSPGYFLYVDHQTDRQKFEDYLDNMLKTASMTSSDRAAFKDGAIFAYSIVKEKAVF